MLLAAAVYLNGTILTMDAANRVVDAVAVEEGRIVGVGSSREMRQRAGVGARVVDLEGRAMLPGFWAAHDHCPAAASDRVDLNSPPIGRVHSIDELVAALRERARATPPGQWVLGRGYDDTLLRERRHPNRRDLDSVSTKHPVWVVHTSGHLGAANSKALAMAGISRDTPQPPGGAIRKDASGEPDGVIEEALGRVARLIPAATREERVQTIRRAGPLYTARGVTTTVIAGGSAESIADLREARDRGWLPLRAVHMMREADDHGDDRIRAGAVKLFQDGSIQGYTGFLSAPYHRQPEGKQDFRGYPARSRAELAAAVRRYHRAGRQIAIHGNGDAAIDDILEAYETAQREFPRKDARHRIEHCQTAREDQLDRMARLGVTPSFFNGHVYYWGDRHLELFLGPARAARISPLASARRRGIRFTLHNDTPVTPVDPLLLIQTAVTRRTRAGAVLGEDQRISVMDALRAVTIDAAWQNFEERRGGSIEPGKFADFTILDENPLQVAPERISSIRVRAAIVGGADTINKR